jgi:hypothetical protein
MFNILVKYDGAAWETDQLMRMDARRFGEYSGIESKGISVTNSALRISPDRVGFCH